VLSAIAKPPLASTSVLGLTAFDKVKRDRVSLDHRFTGGQGLIQSPSHHALLPEQHHPPVLGRGPQHRRRPHPRRHLRQRGLGAGLELHSEATSAG
jgi:hemoglobin/transferrin/lactoferrin receptor protein